VRVAASLRNRVVPAHIVLQRLSSASPSDRVAKALTTLGRIVKTIFILRHIHDDKFGGAYSRNSIEAKRGMN
jgi:TnpA family transposase